MLSRLKQLVFRPVGCAALAMTALVSGCGGGGALTFQFPGPSEAEYQRTARANRADVSPRAADASKLGVRLGDEGQNEKNRRDETKRGRLAVPHLRLPHRKPFASDREESDEPDQECATGSGENKPLGVMKFSRLEPTGPKKFERPKREQDRGNGFAEDDQPEADSPEKRNRQGMVRHRARRQDRVHAQHVLHEQEIRPRIVDVAEHYESAQERDAAGHENLETPFQHHRKAAIQDRISASAHAGSTANPGNNGTRQILMVGAPAS
jgi:hypothetical protein